jgi:hypothetical protein
LHGDLHGGNLLVDDNGVITCGDRLGRHDSRRSRDGSRNTVAESRQSQSARERDARMPRRQRGDVATCERWAVFYGVTLGTSGLAGDTRHAVMARRTLERLVAGP